MLKTISSVANAICALNYKGTWNASTNTPALASGSGLKATTTLSVFQEPPLLTASAIGELEIG